MCRRQSAVLPRGGLTVRELVGDQHHAPKSEGDRDPARPCERANIIAEELADDRGRRNRQDVSELLIRHRVGRAVEENNKTYHKSRSQPSEAFESVPRDVTAAKGSRRRALFFPSVT